MALASILRDDLTQSPSPIFFAEQLVAANPFPSSGSTAGGAKALPSLSGGGGGGGGLGVDPEHAELPQTNTSFFLGKVFNKVKSMLGFGGKKKDICDCLKCEKAWSFEDDKQRRKIAKYGHRDSIISSDITREIVMFRQVALGSARTARLAHRVLEDALRTQAVTQKALAQIGVSMQNPELKVLVHLFHNCT